MSDHYFLYLTNKNMLKINVVGYDMKWGIMSIITKLDLKIGSQLRA